MRWSKLRARIGLVVVLMGFLPASAFAWWNPAWGLRRKITFNNTGQASNLTGFPVLIKLDSTRVEYFRTQNAGQDIRFVDADDTTQLDHEIELWNEAGTSYVWVSVPQINGASSTDYIWMYYDNPAVLDGQNAAGVWSNGYRGVWHLKEDPAGAPPQMKDSANTNHGTALNSPVSAAGQIDGSLSFDGTMDRNVNVPNSASLQLPTNMTVSAWARTTSTDGQARLVVAKWNSTGSAQNYWFGKLNASTFNFFVDSAQAVSISLGLVNNGPWHHVVGVADASAGLLRLYVDGTQQATAAYTGSSQTGTSVLQIGNNPDSTLQNWDGGIDEVRVASVARSADWIRAQYLTMADTFASFGPAACFSGCQALAVVDSGTSVTVTSPSSFELVFTDAAGGHVQSFFDLDEDSTRTYDLAGGLAGQDGLFLDEIGWAVDSMNYRSDKSPSTARGHARLLEVTSARVLVRSDSYFATPSGAVLPGVRGVGDWSVYASGRMALHWKRVTTSAVSTTFDQLHLNLNRPVAAGPLSFWAGFTQSGPICFTSCTGPASDDFVMVQNEQAGVRTDFLKIQYSDWPGATSTWGGNSVGNEWIEDSWMRSAPVSLPADNTETWSFLTHFKPTIFTAHDDPAVTSRSADYRLPDDLASPSPPAAGGGWFDPAESTASPSDFFNEKEAAYALTLDPVAGLNFDLDGGTTPRYHPFFKIRQWRSLVAPPTITLEGVTLTQGVGFRADVMPISRSSMHRNLLWRSSLQDAAAVTSPDVGSAGSVVGGIAFGPARFGSGARLNASGDSIRVPTSGNFDPAQGHIGFWYRPNYDSADGVHHDLLGFFVDANNFWFVEKRIDNNLYFRIARSDGAGGSLVSQYQITSANYSWRSNEWVHITVEWDDGAPLGGQQRIEINDQQPPHVDSAVDYDSTTLTVAAQLRFGNADGDATFAPGDYDEIEIVRAAPVLASGGLLGDATEFLADPTPAKNFTLNFTAVDGSRRGRYLQLGATSKFRGLSVALATPGVGVAAGALEWEYWDGTGWTSLESVAGFTDTTRSLTRTGNVYWTADPPGWAPFSVMGGVDIYRIRMHLAPGSSYSTFPVEGIIKTDVLLLQYCGDVTLDAQTFQIAAPVPTAVELLSFSATPRDGAVDLSWTTATELHNLGFHLYRSLNAAGPWERLTPSLIPGLGSSPTGASYSYRDSGLQNGTTYYYLLEDVETSGRTERHGPASATPQAGGSGGEGSGDDGDGSDGSGDGTNGSGRITYGDPSAATLRIVERGPTHAVLELLTPGFTAITDTDGTVRISIPGFEDTASPGALAVPVRHDSATGRTVLARRLLVRLDFLGIEPGERSLGGSRGRRPGNPPLVRSRGVVAQLVVKEAGLYRVRFEDVFGPTRRGVNAQNLRLSRLGQAVAYHTEPDRALFGPGSSLFFLSEGSSLNPRGDAVYELSLGQTASRMGVVSGAPTGSDTTECLKTVRLEQNHYYQSALLQAPDLWLWDLLVSPVTKTYAFTVDALSASSTSSHLKVVLQGASDFEELDHHLRLSVNGIPVGEATWDGKVEQVIEAEMNAGILVESTNTLSLENVGDAGAAYSMLFLNRFEVSYPRLLTATSGKLEGHFDQPGRAEVLALTANSFVVDTTATPVWLKGTEATPSGLAFRAEAGRSYLAVSDTAVLTPEVRRSVPNGLKSTASRADWVLIAPREFLPAAPPLVALRRGQGLLTKAVALEDVYAEFGFGESSPKAVHDFLAFAFHNWKTRPRYVVLLGDSTYDPKNYLGTGVKDRMPSLIVETSYLWTVSDPSLAAVNGEDLLPDLAIGRLSAGSLEEAQRLVGKLVAFEQAGRTLDGKAVLVADDADLAGNFEADQDEIASSILQGREVEKVYLRDLGGATRATIKAAFDGGPGLVSYVGHGATAVWASENVWNNTDVATLAGQEQQPLLLTLNCLNGFFHFPPFDSLAEAFVKVEGKGAIAAFAPSGLSVNDAAHLYHKALLTEIESGAHSRLGDALLAAQKAYADGGAFPELLSIYHLFGDPAMRIR